MYWWERYGKRTTTAAPKKKTFPLCARPTDIHTMLLLLSFASWFAFLPTAYKLRLFSSPKPKKFAKSICWPLHRKFSPFSVSTHSHTHARTRSQLIDGKYTPRKTRSRSRNLKFVVQRIADTVSHAQISNRSRSVGRMHFAARVDPLFCSSKTTGLQKMVTTRWWLKQIR